MAFENILVKTEGAVGLIQLNRPKVLNALNGALMIELGDAVEATVSYTHLTLPTIYSV